MVFQISASGILYIYFLPVGNRLLPVGLLVRYNTVGIR